MRDGRGDYAYESRCSRHKHPAAHQFDLDSNQAIDARRNLKLVIKSASTPQTAGETSLMIS